MTIDTNRILQTAERFTNLDPLEAYYSMFELQLAATSAIDADSRVILQAAMRDSPRVLDIGCGNGWRLLECRHLFHHGTGIDVSDYAIGIAKQKAILLNTSNVEFLISDSDQLPFDSGQMDFVYSERGPLGYNDQHLREALRVLKPGGRIYVETLGSLNLLESRQVFEEYFCSEDTLLTSLNGERIRSESLGIQISLLAALRRQIRFADVYEWFAWQCSIWRYLEMSEQWPVDLEKVAEFTRRNVANDGSVALTYHPIWIGGKKPC